MSIRHAIAPALFVAALTAFVAADEPAPKKTEPAAEIVIAGQIETGAPADRFFGAPSKLHAMRLEKNTAYVIEATGANVFLHVDDTIGNVLAQGQNRTGKSSRVRFTAPKDDVFLIYAGAHGPLPAAYSLSVKPFAAAAIKTFALPAPAANKPAESQAQLTNDDSPDQYRDFPGKVYVVELKATKSYVIDLMSTQFDAYLILQDPNGALIAQDDDSGGNLNSRLRFQPRADGRYRLVATTFNGSVGAFTLRVTEQ